MNTRKATLHDLNDIKALLKEEGLPYEDCHYHINNFRVLEKHDKIIGIGGIEYYNQLALIRSIAVLKECRGQGIGLLIFSEIKQSALENNIEAMYLLTETADSYFKKLGFSPIDRDSVPEPIKQTRQFSSLCPSSAIVMRCILHNN